MSGQDTEPTPFDSEAERWMDPEFIAEQTGFTLIVIFPDLPANPDSAGMVSYHDEFDRVREECGYQNVFSTVVKDRGKVAMAIFVRRIVPTDQPAPDSESVREHLGADDWLGGGQASPL